MVGARFGRARRRESADAWRTRGRRCAREEHRGRVLRREGPRWAPRTASGTNQRTGVIDASRPAGTRTLQGEACQMSLERTDPEIYAAIEGERRRQVEKIELIASENYTSAAVMEAVGSVLTNKYAEGYPGRRYYGGCEWVDVAETLAIERAKLIVAGATAYPRIFDFPRLRQIADAVEALLLVDMAHFAGLVAAGEHPTPVGYAQIVTTTTHKTLRGPRGGMILSDAEFGKAIDSAVFPNVQGGPLMHVIAGKAVMLKEAATPEFKTYAQQIRVNARTLAASLAKAGLRIVSGGTDNHLMLVDVRPLKLTGKQAEKTLDAVGITVNKNTIPYDPQKPGIASRMRIGTPAITTRGMKEAEMERIGALIGRILQAKGDETVAKDVAAEVLDLTRRFPVPGITPERVTS